MAKKMSNSNNIENKNDVTLIKNSKTTNKMKKQLNLLFIEGNRQKIDKANIKEAYQKISTHGYISTMPMEYLPMEKAIAKLGGRTLFKATVIRKSGQGEATISNFDIRMVAVKAEDYTNYDGVCIDGQHRTLALQFGNLQEIEPTYTDVKFLKTWIFSPTWLYATTARHGTDASTDSDGRRSRPTSLNKNKQL